MWVRTFLLVFVAGTPAPGCRRADPVAPTPVVPPAVVAPIADRLAAPVPVTVDGHPLEITGTIDTYQVTLHPSFGDFNGQGQRALLLGPSIGYQQDGKLQIYPDLGSGNGVRLGPPRWFDETVPTARINPG